MKTLSSLFVAAFAVLALSGFTQPATTYSLGKLNYILPSYIQVLPEGQLTGNFRWDVESASQANVYVDARITGIYINHPGLADHRVNIPDLWLKGMITWNRSEKIISFQNLFMGRNGIMAQMSGQVSYQNAPAVQLAVFLPDTEIQAVLDDAIPADLIPRLQGAQVAGTIGMDILLVADPAFPQNSRFEPGIRINNYALIQAPPGANIPAIKEGGYVHTARKNGLAMRRILLSRNNPHYVSYDQIGATLRQAILKAEDGSFFEHNGFDLDSIRTAIVRDLSAKRFARGGSTITMQLAKNLFLSGQRTLSRKLEESILAYALEKELGKKQIFEIYANIIEWGANIYGISEAAHHYFSKRPSELTPEEATTLASIIPSPQKRGRRLFYEENGL